MAEERILIVDDDPYMRTVLAALLEKEGYLPVIAQDARDAIARLQSEDCHDLILTDVAVSGMREMEFLHAAKAACAATPLVVVSGVREITTAIAAMREGAFDYVLKPFDQQQLLSSIQRAISQRHSSQRDALEKQTLEQLVAARTNLLRAAISDLEQAYDITLEALGDALDLKDAETEGHSRRVTAYTIALARAMGITGNELHVVSRGAFLHDIGKMAIPDAILLKPGKLNPQEQAMMREHCARGYQILKKIPFLHDAAQIVYSHQEHYDGSGYPRQLKGDEIVLGARIFAIADTLDAITSDRPYRRANSFASARQEILRCAGTQFDPEVVKVYDSLPDSLWENLQSEITQHARMLAFSSK